MRHLMRVMGTMAWKWRKVSEVKTWNIAAIVNGLKTTIHIATQAPNGKSKWAKEVKEGKRKSGSVLWAWIGEGKGRTWLLRSVDGKQVVLNKAEILPAKEVK